MQAIATSKRDYSVETIYQSWEKVMNNLLNQEND